MITVKDEYMAGNMKVLILSERVPIVPFNSVQIGDNKYIPEIVYDSNNEIAIKTEKSHIGQIIEFTI